MWPSLVSRQVPGNCKHQRELSSHWRPHLYIFNKLVGDWSAFQIIARYCISVLIKQQNNKNIISELDIQCRICSSVFVIIISAWTTTVVMTVESDYSVKSGALRPQQKIIIITIVDSFFILGWTEALMIPLEPSKEKLTNLFDLRAFSAHSISFNSPVKTFDIEANVIAMRTQIT